MRDAIIDEVRRARDEHAVRFNFDLHAICEDLREKEKECGHRVVSLPPKTRLRPTGS